MRQLVDRLDAVLIPFVQRWSLPALRWSLAIVFIWFGALKVFGVSPVVDLVASTVYWVDPGWFVPVLGVIEVLIGIGLATRIGLRIVLLALIAQMLGTFLVFVVLPDVAFEGGNPFMLTVEGEFVLKNLVLLSAAMVVGAEVDRSRGSVELVDA